MHDESGPPNSHGAPIGNNNAVGNSGGGAPIGNTNAEKYGAWNDPKKEYQRLEGDSKRFVDELVEDFLERSKADLPQDKKEEKARRLAVLLYIGDRGWAHAADEGFSLEREREIDGTTYTQYVLNPAIEADMRVSSKERKLYRELRLLPSPDGRSSTECES